MVYLGSCTTTIDDAVTRLRCDLLSNYGVPWFLHNFANVLELSNKVVICFQIMVYLGSCTTQVFCEPYWYTLWFAFKLWCNLVLAQPNSPFDIITVELWFAFKLWCNLVLAQLRRRPGHSSKSCDLLSNYGVTWFLHNHHKPAQTKIFVVICFQIMV